MRFRVETTYRASILGALLFAANVFCGLGFAALRHQTKQTRPSNAPQQTMAGKNLYLIGEKISKAVLDKDIPTLLSYDRADLRSQDAASLKNSKSDLYCYIFDSDCITWGDGTWRSVYDKLYQAHPLKIKVMVTHSPYDRQIYGSLFFYDAAGISEKDLRSADFRCKEAPTKLASWKFRVENGKWKPVTPLFDRETLGPCPSDVQGMDR
jgi:hypothetical protein